MKLTRARLSFLQRLARNSDSSITGWVELSGVDLRTAPWLVAEGLAARIVETGLRRPKYLYRITDAGRRVLEES